MNRVFGNRMGQKSGSLLDSRPLVRRGAVNVRGIAAMLKPDKCALAGAHANLAAQFPTGSW